MLGFTLVELMGVILILCLISFLMAPTIIKQIINSKSKLDSLTEKLLVSATELYLDNKESEFPKSEGADYYITLLDLVNDKKIKSPLLDSNGNEIDLQKTISIEVVNGKYKYNILSGCRKVELVEECVVSAYSYRDESVVFRAPQTGIYKIELWGADGGYNSTFTSSKGAYTSGEIELTKGEVLYVTVGQKGRQAVATDTLTLGGYNGGGGGTGAYSATQSGGSVTDKSYVVDASSLGGIRPVITLSK